MDFVVHEAAITSVQKSIEEPLRVNEVNVTGTLNLLKACLDSDVGCFTRFLLRKPILCRRVRSLETSVTGFLR